MAQAERISALLNNAYTTLKDPVARSKYLLELRGIQYGEDTVSPDKEFLMDIMELREDIESASETELLKIKQDLEKRNESLIKALSDCYKQESLDSNIAIDLTSKLNYIAKCQKALNNRLPST